MKKFFQNKIKLLISLTFLILFVFNTVAYSGLATKLAITSEAMFRPITDIRVTDIKLDSATNGAVESYSPKFNVDTTTTGFVLPNANSTITYKVKVTNYGNVNQTIYNFIKNSINSNNVNIKITDFTSVCADDSCSQKNSDFTIIHHNGDNSTDSNEKEILITFSTIAPSDQTINVIEKYDFRPIYNINYDANGGQNAPKSQIKIYKDNLTLTKEEPTRPTYKFLGWSTSSKSTTAEYKAGDSYNPGTNEEVKDIILYAVWQKKQATIDLNYVVDGKGYVEGYDNRILTGIKVNGEDKGYLNDFSGTYDYGTSYEIYGFKIDGVTIPYSKKYTVDGTNHLGISFNTINFKVNDTNLGSVTPTQLIVIPGTTYTISNNVITLSDGRIATASPKTVTGYTSKFSSYTITPNSTTINTKITATANFTKKAEKYTITLDNKSATTAGTTAIYEKYGAGIYLDSALKNVMTTTTNKITVPAKTGYTFKGYYTKENGQGDQIINENGYITDKATNTTYIANTTLYAYWIDNIAPEITELINTSNGNWTNQTIGITVKATDLGSGIKRFDYSYDNKNWVTTWTNGTITDITNGKQRYDTWAAERNEPNTYFRVIDNAGNISASKKTSIRIDKTTPKIELNGAASSSEINNSNNVTIPIKITETASGINNSEFTASDISVLINGTTVNPSTKTLTYNSVSNGVYSYTLTLSGITLNGKVTLEIATGAVKDIATNSNVKTTLDPSITVSNIYTISLNGNGATTAGTPAIYEKYNTGIYLDSTLTKAMTTSTNPIPTTPSRSYTVSFNANNTGITMPSAITKSYSYSGYYTDATNGTQMINENGYITSSFKNTSYTTNGTLYAHWEAKPSVTIPNISQTGYTCSWNTSADGNGTTYNAGDVTDKLNTQTLYAVCKANSYKMTFDSNKKYVEAPSAGGFQITKMSDSDGEFYRTSFSNSFNTTNSWYWIAYKNYAFTAGSNYRIRAKFRIVENENISNVTLRHAAISNDYWTSGLKGANIISSSLNTWKEYSLDRVINSSYTNSSGTSYDASPRLEIYTQNLAATSGTINRKLVLDIKDVYINKITDQDKTYGTTFGTLPTDSREGYTFNGWYTDATGGTQISSTTSVPSKDTTYYAHWTANTNTKYVVKHYKQKLDGTYPSEADDTDNLTGTTDSSVSPVVKDVKNNSNYIGFTAPSVQTVTIAGDGSTVVTYKYTRNKYTFTLGSTTGITTTGSTASGSYYYGSTITLKATANTGYIFTGWTSSNTNLVANQTNASATFTMPVGNITMTPNVTVNPLIFNSQSKTIIYNSTSNQTVSITPATGGSESYKSYSYSIVFGNADGYFSINGTTITVKAGTPANTYTLKVLATDTNTKATKEATITITIGRKSVTKPKSPAEKIYNATTQNHGITPSEGSSIVANKSTLSAINIGTYNVVFTLNSNYKWSDETTDDVTVIWKINPYNLSNGIIESVNEQTYIGSEITPKPNVTVPIPSGKTTLLSSVTDYTYSYSNNTNVGTGTIKVTGKGNYTGTKSITFKIVQAENPVKVNANTLTYNAKPQNLVTTSNAQGIICYSTESVLTSNCSTSGVIPQGTNAGTYTVYYYVNGNSNYKAKSGSVIVTIGKYNLSNATISGLSNKTYNGNAQTQSGFTVGVPIPSGSTPTYTVAYSNNTNAGTATMTLTGTGNYTGTKSATFTINKATNPGTATANTLSYTGKGQDLVSSSNVKGYICYSLSSAPTSCSANSAIPQGTNAGIYKVYYFISGDNNYNSKSGTVDVTIGRVNAVCPTVSVSSASITYDDQSHGVVISGGSGGTIQYRTSTTASWTTTKPTITNAGEMTTYVQVAGDSNHNTVDCGNKKITIGKRATTCTTASVSKDYNGTALTANSGTCTNLVSGHSATVSASGTITNAGSTANTYKSAVIKNSTAEVTTNYNITSVNGTLTVKKVSAKNPTLTAYSGTYDGLAHTIGVSGGSGGTIQYSTDNKTWSTTKPTRTNVGTTTVYVKVVGDSNHTDTSAISSTIMIKSQQLPAPTNIKITTAGIVTWDFVSNATSYQISIDGTNWTTATSGVDYLSKIIESTGARTVEVKAIGNGNYSNSNPGSTSVNVYTVTINSNSTTMGTVDTSSYNVISGAKYSASSNKLSFIGTTTGSTTKTLKTVTATAKSNYTFNNWSSVSGSITSNVTLTANFNSSEFTISLNPNGGTGGTSAIYERYNKGIYLDSGTNSKQMTTSANAITKPTKEPYTISFNANNTGATVPSNYSFSPVFNGYYTATTSNGTQMIDNRGYITNNLTSTKYTSNTTLYAQWNHYYTLPSLSKGGNTCKWAIGSASGTKYNSGTSLFINDNKVFYAVCTPNKYKVKFEPNGGTSSATEMDVTYDSPYGTLPTVTRSASKVNDITINYVFEGWYDSNGTKITETSIVETPSDHTLYAHWLSSPNIKGGTAESWSSTAITISLNIPSTSDTGTVSYQYYLSETNELPESATWTDITSADGSVSISKNGEFYIFYKATSSAGVSITSNYNKLQIDTQTPSTSITAYQAGTTTTVASNKWINKNLEFKMGALNVGPSKGSIYYCIGDSCTPNTLISPNTAIPADLTNTKTGIYKVRYKAVSNAGLSSSIGEYVAKVDKTAPTMKAVVKSLKDNSTLANLTNSSTTYIDSTWRSYGYSINLNGTTDSQSGISSIERFTNANNLKRADADYKANLHKGVITDTKTFSESGDGAKYAKFVATDNAGNTTTFTVEVLIDKTAPTVGVNIYKAKDASTKTGSVICSLPNGCDEAFKWTSYGYYFDFSPSSDELSGIDYYTMRYTAGGKSSVDTSSYEERNVHSAYTTVTSSGARRLEFTATDKAGNTSTYVAKNIYIDMDDPNLVIKLYKADSSGNKTGSVLKTITDNNTAINSWTNYRHYFDLSGSSDSLSGIEKITMQINDSGIVTTGNTASGTSDLKTTYTITSTKHQVVGSSGNRYARFTITDKVGNTSVKNVRIYIDLDSPTLDSASLSPQFQSSTTIKYTCSDKTSGFASFGTKTLSKTYTKNVTSSNSPVKIQCKDTAGNTSSGTRTYTWSANSDKCGTTTEDVYSNGYYCDAGNAASANSSACISYATNTGKTTKYVNKRCMYYCNAKTGTTTVAKTCWHQ